MPFDPAPRTPALLKGYLVVELASVLAGPSVGSFLAELGARVIKVENPRTGGDVTRAWKTADEPAASASGAYYASANWKKESIWLDLHKQDDKAHLFEWIAKADILLSSFRPGSEAEFGLAPPMLLRQFPRLICARILGYGPDDRRAAYDLVLQAETGWMAMNGFPDREGLKMPVALMDVLAAHQLKQAVLLALWQRDRDGQGALVEVSLYDAALSALCNQASNYLMSGAVPQRLGSLHPNIAPYGETMTTADGAGIVLACGSDLQFNRLCSLAGLPELAAEEVFRSNAARVKNREKLQEKLQTAFRNKTASEWLDLLEKNGVPAGRIRSLDQVFGDPSARKMILANPEVPKGDDPDSGRQIEQRMRQIAFFLRNPGETDEI